MVQDLLEEVSKSALIYRKLTSPQVRDSHSPAFIATHIHLSTHPRCAPTSEYQPLPFTAIDYRASPKQPEREYVVTQARQTRQVRMETRQ